MSSPSVTTLIWRQSIWSSAVISKSSSARSLDSLRRSIRKSFRFSLPTNVNRLPRNVRVSKPLRMCQRLFRIFPSRNQCRVAIAYASAVCHLPRMILTALQRNRRQFIRSRCPTKTSTAAIHWTGKTCPKSSSRMSWRKTCAWNGTTWRVKTKLKW